MDDPGAVTGVQTLYLGAAATSKKLWINIDRLKPGGTSCKYHSHSLKEEFFLILRGSGTIRIGDEQLPVKQGDFLAKPAGVGLAHQFINSGNDVLEILDCSTDEPDDAITYPDEQVVYLKRLRQVFRIADALKDWSS